MYQIWKRFKILKEERNPGKKKAVFGNTALNRLIYNSYNIHSYVIEMNRKHIFMRVNVEKQNINHRIRKKFYSK